MFPSFNIFGREIGLYPVMAIIGLLLAGIIAFRAAKKRGLDDNKMLSMLFAACGGLLVGGHLLYAITNYRYIEALIQNRFQVITSFARFLDMMGLIFGGSVFYGGLIGGMIAAAIYAKKAKIDFGAYSDAAAPSVPLFHVFGRLGCFFGGCCFGIESRFGLTTTLSPIQSGNGVSRFPVQLTEATFNLALFVFLSFMLKNNKLKSRLFLLYLMIYPVGRFFLEFLRGDEIRGFVFGLSTSQFISIMLLVFSSTLMFLKTRGRKSHLSIDSDVGAC